MTDAHFTRSQMLALSGVPNDVLTFWQRSGLIATTEPAAGQGKHLKFDADQVRLARLLAQGRSLGLNVGALRAVHATMAKALHFLREFAVDGRVAGDISSAVADLAWANLPPDEIAFVAAHAPDHGHELHKSLQPIEGRYSPDVVRAVRALEREGDAFTSLVGDIAHGEGLLSLYNDGGEWKAASITEVDAQSLPCTPCIIFDLAPVFAPLTVDGDKA